MNRLKIWQQNLNKSAQAQFNMIFNADPSFDILAMQELNIDKYGNTKSISKYYPIYLATHAGSDECKRSTCSVLLVNKQLSTGSWSPIPIHHPDITAIQLTGSFSTV